jgi:hypothetical protein
LEFVASCKNAKSSNFMEQSNTLAKSMFGWLVADGWCWFVLREEYCWLVAGGWFVLREKYCWLVADKPSEQGPAINYPSTTREKIRLLFRPLSSVRSCS